MNSLVWKDPKQPEGEGAVKAKPQPQVNDGRETHIHNSWEKYSWEAHTETRIFCYLGFLGDDS